MGRLQWGLIGAVILVTAVVVLAMQGAFTDGGAPGQTVRPDETAAGGAVDEAADAPARKEEPGGPADGDGDESRASRSASDENDVPDSPGTDDESDENDVSDSPAAVAESDEGGVADSPGTDDESDEGSGSDSPAAVEESDEGGVADSPATDDESDEGGVADSPGTDDESDENDVSDSSGTNDESDQGSVSDSPAAVEESDEGGVADSPATVAESDQDGVSDSPGTDDESDQGGVSGSSATVAESDERGVSDSPATVAESDQDDETDSSGTVDESDDALQAEAESYVRQLAEPSEVPLQVESAEGFVGADRPLASAGADSGSADATRPDAAEAEDAVSHGPDDVAEADVEVVAPSGAAEAGAADGPRMEDSEDGGEAAAPSAPDAAESGETPAPDARETGPADIRAARVDLPLSEEAPITIAELLGAEEVIPADAVFYVHTVRPDDVRGIWGIVHDGIVENFAAGVAVHRGETTETYRVDIPPGADQRRPDSSSSFLGRIIYEKSQRTYVYNYQTDRLGRNPDLIFPGQEIVIVSFTPEELVEIYKYFVGGA